MDDAVRAKSLKAGLAAMLWSATMVGFGEASFALYAAHVLAPDKYFGLLAGIPNLLGPMAQVFGANVLDRTKHRKRLVQFGIMTQCLLFVPMALLAFSGSTIFAQKIFLPMVIIYFVSGNFGGPAWNSLISELCPSSERAHYFARNARNCGIMSLSAKLILFCAVYYAAAFKGADAAQFEAVKFQRMSLIFTGMFLISFVARYISYRAVLRMYEPNYAPPPEASFTFWQFISRVRESNFVKYVIFVAAFYFGAFVSAPFYLPNVVKALHHEQWEWVVIDSGSALCSVLTFLYWGRFSARFGNRATMAFTSVLLSLIPILWILSDRLIWFIGCQCLAGGLWSGFTLSCSTYIMEAVTPTKRARCFAYFSIFLGAGSFLGAMVGTLLLDHMPPALTLGSHTFTVSSNYTYVFLASFVFRLIASIFFVKLFRELRPVQPFSLRTWATEIVGVRFPVGLRLGWLANQQDESDDPKTEPSLIVQDSGDIPATPGSASLE
jgi:MFS family permease